MPTADTTSVLFLCLGNICRSPLAQGVLEHHAIQRGIADRLVVDSAGTSAYHVGERPDPGSIRVARDHGIDITRQRSRQLVADDFERFDFIVAMDRSNRRNALRVGTLPSERLILLREFDPEALDDFDVPDPWGGGSNGFELVYSILDRSMDAFIEHMTHHGPYGRG